MSQTADGQRIACDGEGCTDVALLPVALRAVLGSANGVGAQAADQWLFVRRDGCWRHYCPDCAGRLLMDAKSGGSIVAATAGTRPPP